MVEDKMLKKEVENLGVRLNTKRAAMLEKIKENCESALIGNELDLKIQEVVLAKVEELLKEEKELNNT